VRNAGAKCPAIYGDPALLSPLVFDPEVKIEYEIGLVLRWSEDAWLKATPGAGVTIIDLGTDDVEGVIRKMKACKKIITSSLHGLIIADAYGIPNAWLASGTPKGGEFKFYDYFLSVDKVRHAVKYDVSKSDLQINSLEASFEFDQRIINFDPHRLLSACPLLVKKN
jgi:pyruvyltransferase